MKFNHGDFSCDADIFKKDDDLTVRFHDAASEQDESQIKDYVYVNPGYGFITLKFKGEDGLLSGFLHGNVFSDEAKVDAAIEFVENLSPLSKNAYIPHHVEIVKSTGAVVYNGEFPATKMPENRFQILMDNLETRGSMYIHQYNYSNLISYVTGYDNADYENGNNSNLEGFKELVTAKFGSVFALHWSAIISDCLAESDEEAIKMFFLFYHELVHIKKSKGLNFLKEEYERISKFRNKRKTNLKWPEK